MSEQAALICEPEVATLRVETTDRTWALSPSVVDALLDLDPLHLQLDPHGLRAVVRQRPDAAALATTIGRLTAPLEPLSTVEIREDLALLSVQPRDRGALVRSLTAAGVTVHAAFDCERGFGVLVDRRSAQPAQAAVLADLNTPAP